MGRRKYKREDFTEEELAEGAKRLEEMEKRLGVTFERQNARIIPGTHPEGSPCLYFLDNGNGQPKEQFDKLTSYIKPLRAKKGMIWYTDCHIKLPDGRLFHPVEWHGDIDGWREQITLGANALNLSLAEIKDNYFVVEDGVTYPLTDCNINFDSGSLSPDSPYLKKSGTSD